MWRPARSSSLVPRRDRVSPLDLAAKWRHGPTNDATPGPRAARVRCSKLASPPRKRTRPAEDDRAAVRDRGPRLTRPACRVDPIAVPAKPNRVTGVAGIAPEGTPEPAGTDRARVAGRLGTATQGTATWGWRGLADTFDQGARPREVVHHGDHGGSKDAAITALVHGGVQGRDRRAVPAR